jgi:hypothetical protein
MAASDIGLDEGCRKFEEHPPGRDRHASDFKIDRLLVGVAVELGNLVPQGADGPMVNDRLQPSDLCPRLKVDPVVN